MTEPLDLCSIETIEIALYGGRSGIKVERVTGHRFLDFAIHRDTGGDLFNSCWCITHLPTGRRVGDGFRAIEPAAAAMVEIARLRNDWSCLSESDASRDVAERVKAILKTHDPRSRLGDGRKGQSFKLSTLNGYAEQSSA